MSQTEWWNKLVAWPTQEPVKFVRVLGVSLVALAGGVAYYVACTRHGLPVPPSFDGSAKAAQAYCASLTSEAAQLSTAHFFFGWALTLVVLVGAAWTLAKIDKVDGRMIWIACVSGLALSARSVLMRADAASELSVAATTARTLDGALDGSPPADVAQAIFSTCSRGWAAWVKSRTDSSAIARSALEQTVNALKQSTEKSTDTARSQAAAAQQAAQTANGAVAKAEETVNQHVTELKKVAAELQRSPNDAAAAGAKIEALTSAIQTSVTDAASNAASAVQQGVPDYVLVLGTDTDQKEGCSTLAMLVKTLPKAKLYSNATRTQWMTVAGPSSKDEADRIRTTTPGLRKDVTVRSLRPDWSLESCAAK